MSLRGTVSVSRRLAWILGLAGTLVPWTASGAPPSPVPSVGEGKHFAVGFSDVYLHRQQVLPDVFNDQHSDRITQSCSAKRLDAEWWLWEDLAIAGGFQLPTRDEQVRRGDLVLESYHYPKTVELGVSYIPGRLVLSEKGWLELGLDAGLEFGLSQRVTANLWPTMMGSLRFVLSSGTALEAGGKYIGLGEEGFIAVVLGVFQRI